MSIKHSPFIQALQDQGAKVYTVGGTVRDQILELENHDIDLLVARLPLAQITKTLQQWGSVQTVGKSFGVIKFIPKGESRIEYDIALPRKEVSTGTGHRDFDIDFDPLLPIEVDLSRRDFTVNAMAVDCGDGQRIDPFNGHKDLQEGLLRMVSDKSFEEDPLRMLRGIQFAARFNLKFEPITFQAIQEHAPLLQSVSPERITMELKKLFMATKPSKGFVLMRDTGILQEVFPELHQNVGVEQGNKLANDDVFLHTMRVLDASRGDQAIPNAGDMELMLSALFHDIGKAKTKRFDKKKNKLTFYGHQFLSKKMALRRMEHLKMTILGINPDSVGHLVEHHMFQTKSFFTERAIRRFINKIGPEHILKLVDLRIADNRGGKYPDGIRGVLKLRNRIADELAKKTPLSVKDLALDGHDIMQLGVKHGPMIGKVLKDLVEVILDYPEKNTREDLTVEVQKILGASGDGSHG